MPNNILEQQKPLQVTTKVFNKAVLDWFNSQGRKDLPWQQNPTAYRVWVSEIMLQQTQVNTVIPYYKKFITKFPNLSELANASNDQVMALWSGLGYYSRARNLHRTAILLVGEQRYSSSHSFPETMKELESLPGIGRSTAGAILALAMQKKAAILDGNVKRVLARCFKIAGWPGKADIQKQLWQLSEQLTPDKQIRNYTQAMMDLGATVCTTKQPDCGACPLHSMCLARKDNNPEAYPGKKKKKQLPVKSQYFFLLRSEDGELLMEKRPPAGIWGGLWTPLSCDTTDTMERYLKVNYGINISDKIELAEFRHTFSHFHLQLRPVKVMVNKINAIAESNLRWGKVDYWLEQGIPAAVRTMLLEI